MRQRTAVIVAMVLSTFVLLIIAGVIGRLAIAPATSDGIEDAPIASAAASAQSLSQEREAEYQELLQTANARLEQANRQLENAYQQLTTQPTRVDAAPAPSAGAVAPSSAASPAASSAPSASASAAPQAPAQITADQAAAIATAYAGGGVVERVRLEEEHGQLVYEVRFTNDSRVYVDPGSGSVLYARLEGSSDDSRESEDD